MTAPPELTQLVLDSLPAAVYCKDLHGRYTLINRWAAERFAGRTASELLGSVDADYLPDDVAQVLREADARARRDGHCDVEVRIGDRVFHDRKIARRDARQRVCGVCGVAVEVTTEPEMAREYREAMRLEALGRMARGVVHDFNHVIGIIGLQADLIRRARDAGELDPELLDKQLGRIESGVSYSNELVAQLAHFTRVATADAPAVSMSSMVQELDSSGLLDFPSVELRFDLRDGDDDWVGVGRVAAHQMLHNLTLNARDAMPEGGVLTISISRTATHAIMAIHDTGVGMPEAVSEHIFEPFFTTKTEHQGTGLGLAIVDGLIEAAGGEIRAESRAGEGTTMTVSLPLVDPED